MLTFQDDYSRFYFIRHFHLGDQSRFGPFLQANRSEDKVANSLQLYAWFFGCKLAGHILRHRLPMLPN